MALNFFVSTCLQFFTDLKYAYNSASLDTDIDFLGKNSFWVILALFADFEAKRDETGRKKLKSFFIIVS